MCDISKPDLLIHPDYVKSLQSFDLSTYFNVITLDDLMKSVDTIMPYLVTDTGISRMNDVVLSPVFREVLSKRSGIKPHYTSYSFDCDIPIYTVAYRAPRYVIWTLDDDLTVCATCVDRVDQYSLYEAYRRAKDWSYTITRYESIIVFDLDETLIDRNCNKLKCTDKLLECCRMAYDRVVLYSHGSNLHVDDNVSKFKDDSFDLILSNNLHDKVCNKNLLSLYNYFPNTLFTKATLVDDSLYNWTPEYNKFIVPFKLSSVNNIISLIE